MENKEFEALWSKLIDVQKQIIFALYYDTDFCYGYAYLIDKVPGYSREELKRHVTALRKAGLVRYERGLFDDDGQTAGSGFTIEYSKARLIGKKYDSEINHIEKITDVGQITKQVEGWDLGRLEMLQEAVNDLIAAEYDAMADSL